MCSHSYEKVKNYEYYMDHSCVGLSHFKWSPICLLHLVFSCYSSLLFTQCLFYYACYLPCQSGYFPYFVSDFLNAADNLTEFLYKSCKTKECKNFSSVPGQWA